MINFTVKVTRYNSWLTVVSVPIIEFFKTQKWGYSLLYCYNQQKYNNSKLNYNIFYFIRAYLPTFTFFLLLFIIDIDIQFQKKKYLVITCKFWLEDKEKQLFIMILLKVINSTLTSSNNSKNLNFFIFKNYKMVITTLKKYWNSTKFTIYMLHQKVNIYNTITEKKVKQNKMFESKWNIVYNP